MKLTQKGKELYEATKELSVIEWNLLREVGQGIPPKHYESITKFVKSEIKSLKEKGLIEGE